MMRHVIAVWCVLFATTVAAADASRFTVERPVTPAAPGPNRLPVDVPLLAATRALRHDGSTYLGGLEDLRLFTRDGSEVGYLVIPPPTRAAVWRSGRMLPVQATDEESGFELDLDTPATVDRIEIQGLGTPLLKRLRLEGSGDRTRWVVLAAEATIFDLPDEGLRQREVAFPMQTLRYVRVTWDDRASARVGMPWSAAARVVDAPAPPEPVRVPVPFERRPSEPGRSRFRVRLPGPALPIRALELEVRESRLFRAVEVSQARLIGEEVVQRPLGATTLRRAARGDLVASALRIAVAPSEPELELVVDDGDNPPLDLVSVTAELAPLPWVYFESADGAPIVARFGDAMLQAPRYDLEAARGAATASNPPVARWGEPIALRPEVAEPSSTSEGIPGVGAALDPSAFEVARAIAGGPPGLTALVLDAAVLARSPSFADLRIVDAENRQIPYVVERLEEPLRLDLPALAGTGAPPRIRGTSEYALALPYATLPPGRLVLTTSARVFERRVAIEVERRPSNPRDPVRREVVRSERWRHADPERAAPTLVIHLPPLGTTTATLTVDDGDNSALPIGPPVLLLPAARLRFVRLDSGPLRLLYGGRSVATPRYDLQLLAPQLLGARAVEATLGGPPEASSREAARSTDARVFWVAIGLAVAGLLWMLARLLGAAGDEAPKPGAP